MSDYSYINELPSAELAELTDSSVFEVEKRNQSGSHESRSIALAQLRLLALSPLNDHVSTFGKVGHIPVSGIGDAEVDSLAIGKIRGLVERLIAIEAAIESISSENESFVFTLADLTHPDYYFYGGKNSSDEWRIHRWSKSGVVQEFARVALNSAYTTLTEAWAARSDLVYEL